MASTFFGLNIGASALSTFQVAVNTTANNISNVATEGYSRQNANMEATNALRVAARYGSTGTGVAVTSIKQERDYYYDKKYWENNSSLGFYEQKLYYLDQIQTVFKDDSTVQGFASIFANMFNGLDTLKTNPSDLTVRNQFINQAQSLCTYFNSLYNRLSEVQDDCNEEIKSTVGNVNTIGEKISLLNKEINQVETGTGAYANELRDQRAKLIDELSELVKVETNETEVQNTNGDNLGGTYFTVKVNGEMLVDNYEYRSLVCVASDTKMNQSDNDGLYSIVWADTNMDFSATAGTSGGRLKALFSLRDGDNADNLTGQIGDMTTTSITIDSDISITELNALNLPKSNGTIIVNNRTFTYDSWDAEIDENGKISSMTFNLSEEMSPEAYNSLNGKGYTLISGSGIDAMGIPYYMSQINQFIRNFSELFNNIESEGENLNGDKAPTFFQGVTVAGTVYDFDGYPVDADGKRVAGTVSSTSDAYFQLTAANYTVNNDIIRDSSLMATATDSTYPDSHDIVERLMKLQKDTEVFRGDNASAFLETLISDVSVDTEKSEIYDTVYSNLEATIGNQRMSISGVDEDEEALNLVKYQNAYNLASKMISVMAEMLDVLITQTGVT